MNLLQSNGPSYINTVTGTLAVDGWAVTFGTATRSLVIRFVLLVLLFNFVMHCIISTVVVALEIKLSYPGPYSLYQM